MAGRQRRKRQPATRIASEFRIRPCAMCSGTYRPSCPACSGAGRQVVSGPTPRAVKQLQRRLATQGVRSTRRWGSGGDGIS